MRRHPTMLLFWAFVASVVLWIAAAAFVPPTGRWGPIGGGPSELAGPFLRGPMAGWHSGPYVLSATGAPPQIADVERALNRWLVRVANPRLKLGPVTEAGSDAFQADVVTKDGSLVQRFRIERPSGRITIVED